MASKRIVFPAAGLAAVAVAAGGVVAAASSSGSSHSGATGGMTPTANLYGSSMASTMPAPAPKAQSTPMAQAARADPHGQLRFNTNRLTTHPGAVQLVLTNPSSAGMPHGIAIRGGGVNSTGRIVGPGGTSTVTAKLKRGKYTFFCPVPGHAQAGMTGTLTVR
jgi:uncharacterized cupredoxin-like copper-binding protein